MSGPASVFGIYSFQPGDIKNWFNVDNKQDLLGQVPRLQKREDMKLSKFTW